MNNNQFEYSYRAPTQEQRQEIESIRSGYVSDSQEEKLACLRRLNRHVRNMPMVISLTLGVVGVLVFGLGMSMVLAWNLLGGGIAVSAVGIVPIALAAPVHNLILRHEKKKYGPQILRLSDELLGKEPAPKDSSDRKEER